MSNLEGRLSVEEAKAMATKAGVWIDHKQAIVVLLTDAGAEITKFKSGIGSPARSAGDTRQKHKYTPNDFIAEDRRERKLVDDRKKVYEEVLAGIRGADALLILGPGEAKGEFSKHILAKKRRGLAVEVETVDKMTERQIAVKVQQHFSSERTSSGKARPSRRPSKGQRLAR
jgi:hypothetical protein